MDINLSKNMLSTSGQASTLRWFLPYRDTVVKKTNDTLKDHCLIN